MGLSPYTYEVEPRNRHEIGRKKLVGQVCPFYTQIPKGALARIG